MMWGIVRGIFYLWFSFAAGFIAVQAMILALGGGAGLPGGGVPLVVFPPLLILGSLVSTQWNHFGKPISVWRWIALCVVVTVAALATTLLAV